MSDAVVIQQAYRFVLDPTAEQEQFLSGCVGASRFWFNHGLALVKQRLNERAEGADVDVPWSYVARIGRFTPTARGGPVSLVHLDEHSPVKREDPSGSPQRRKALAAA